MNSAVSILRAFGVQVWSEGVQILKSIRRIGPSQFQIWVLSALIGMIVGVTCHYFIAAMQWVERLLYQADTNNLLYWVHARPWWQIMLIPVFGGLITGLVLSKFTENARGRSISHVIEAAALKNGRVHEGRGVASAVASFVTLSTGGSTGQEGPLVHLGAVISTRFAKLIDADGHTARDFLACAAAAAIGASFNAPIAGILFAFEIILRHLSISSFTPITIAAITGTIAGHVISGGDFAAVSFFELEVTTYSEIPAFLLLGLVAGIVAVVLVRAVFVAEDMADMVQSRVRMPDALRPAFAGLLLGIIAINFPHIIGVGYQTTVKALHGNMDLWPILLFVFFKILAVAITLGGRMGGGIFSPALMVGALTGLGFGIIATQFAGTDVGHVQLYALAGMAAVAAAVLGAPLSTSLIIFEMTRDWQAAIAVLAAVSMATGIANRLLDKSFFLTQLERRGLHIAAGPQAYLQATFKVTSYMRELTLIEKRVADFLEKGALIYDNQSFEEAMPKFEALNLTTLLVLNADTEEVIGQLDYLDVLKAYSHALADTSAEEHD